MIRIPVMAWSAALVVGLAGIIALGAHLIGQKDASATARLQSAGPAIAGPARAPARDLVLPQSQRQPAAPFRLTTASFADGSTFDLAAERGNVVVLFFMAAWCTTCIPEARALNELHEAYGKRGVRILAIDIDPRDTEPQLARFRRLAGNSRHLWARDADQNVIRTYGVRTLDTTVVIDRAGNVAYADAFVTGYDRLQDVVEALL